MKAILEFNLPEEQEAHRHAVYAGEMVGVLHDVDQDLRSFLKHGNSSFDTPEAVAHHVRGQILDILLRVEP